MAWQLVSQGSQSEASAQNPRDVLSHPLVVPLYISGVSAFTFLVGAVYQSKTVKSLRRRIGKKQNSLLPNPNDDSEELDQRHDDVHTSLWSGAKAQVHACGGPVIFAYKVFQFLACLGLLGISVAVFILSETGTADGIWSNGLGHRKHSKKSRHSLWFSELEWIQLALSMFYVGVSTSHLARTIAHSFR